MPATRTVYISVGSNSTDKQKIISETLKNLAEVYPDIKFSDIYSTPCWRAAGPDYLNVVGAFMTDLERHKLISDFKLRETNAGRHTHISEDFLRPTIIPLDIDLVIDDTEIIRPRDYDRFYFRKGFFQLCDPRNIHIDDYQYILPEQRIARHPLPLRDSCKLLVYNADHIITDTSFRSISKYLPEEAMLVCNNTRVINARLYFTKDTGATIEIFCLEPDSPADYQLNFASTCPVRWKCLIGNSKRWKNGELSKTLNINGRLVRLTAERISTGENGESVIEFAWTDTDISFSDIIYAAGTLPIPPYLNRETEDSDNDDYQTVYSHIKGSVAAPTAGLHFTDTLLNELQEKGIAVRYVTLHVGAGTFRPVKSDTMNGHDMHAELIDVSYEFIKELRDTQRPVIAVGTTSVRTLESLYHIGCRMAQGVWEGSLDQWYPYAPEHPGLSRYDALQAILDFLDRSELKRLITTTRIIIAPSYRFRIVNSIITNFHQPGSTLLLLIAAVVGNHWHDIYQHALDSDYRFLSYGDACLFLLP